MKPMPGGRVGGTNAGRAGRTNATNATHPRYGRNIPNLPHLRWWCGGVGWHADIFRAPHFAHLLVNTFNSAHGK